jgi:hypothetical protein
MVRFSFCNRYFENGMLYEEIPQKVGSDLDRDKKKQISNATLIDRQAEIFFLLGSKGFFESFHTFRSGHHGLITKILLGSRDIKIVIFGEL